VEPQRPHPEVGRQLDFTFHLAELDPPAAAGTESAATRADPCCNHIGVGVPLRCALISPYRLIHSPYVRRFVSNIQVSAFKDN
jgi:hypothetical protein